MFTLGPRVPGLAEGSGQLRSGVPCPCQAWARACSPQASEG